MAEAGGEEPDFLPAARSPFGAGETGDRARINEIARPVERRRVGQEAMEARGGRFLAGFGGRGSVGRMGESRVLSALATLLLTWGGGLGCVAKHVKSTVAFADESAASLGSLSTLPAMAGDLCWKRAWVDRANQRLISKESGFGSRPSWSKWMTVRGKAEGRDWKTQCEGIAATQTSAGAALAALATYAGAVKQLAEGGSYAGSDLSNIAEQASGLAAAVDAPAAARALQPLGEPLTQITHLLFQAYASHQLKGFLQAGDPLVQRVIAALLNYLEVIDAEAALLQQRQGQILDKLETQLSTPSGTDPARAIAFLDYAAREERSAVEIHDTLALHRNTLKTLASRHATLAREADPGTALQTGNPR